MSTLTPLMVYHQPDYIPASLHIWQDENSGVGALLNAASDIANGRIVSFALCKREGTLTPEIVEVVNIGMGTGGNPAEGYSPTAPRYCGEGNDPDGPGSHLLYTGTYDVECTNPARIAVAMARAFSASKLLYFRLR